MKTQDPILASETEQLEPEHVQWLFQKGYATKDKQATRMTKAGVAWLTEIQSGVAAMLAKMSQRSKTGGKL